MKVTCPHCRKSGSIPDHKVSFSAIKINCPNCKKSFILKPERSSEKPDSIPPIQKPEPAAEKKIETRRPTRGKAVLLPAILIIGLVLGYFAGREHVKRQTRESARQAVSEAARQLQSETNLFTRRSSTPGSKAAQETAAIKTAPEKPQNSKESDLVFIDSSTYARGGFLIIDGVVRNTSDKTLKYVEITVQCLDEQGRLIKTEKNYSSPPHINAGDEAVFRIMTFYNEKIKRFKTSAQWKD